MIGCLGAIFARKSVRGIARRRWRPSRRSRRGPTSWRSTRRSCSGCRRRPFGSGSPGRRCTPGRGAASCCGTRPWCWGTRREERRCRRCGRCWRMTRRSFAGRALFAHPFGIPFPHTALIPRNRQRIIDEIRDLVLTQWLPRPMLVAKAQQFDFVGQALLPAAEPLRPHLRELVRNIGRELVKDLEPGPLAELMARGLAGAVDSDKVRPFLAEAVRRVREQGWLAPLVREWAGRFSTWAETPACRVMIQGRLEGAAENYAGDSW